jgi:luciferase-type oxidoreductase
MEQNTAFQRLFAESQLTLGIFVPIEAYAGDVPTMRDHLALVQRAEAVGFTAVWVRDVPLHDPHFGDVGQIYDPWVYLGYLAAQTTTIALATGSIIFPLRHPIDLAKAAASVEVLSGGRLMLGIASGDRPVEYPAYGVDYPSRAARFRDTLRYFRQLLDAPFPAIESPLGTLPGADLLPKPSCPIPIFVTGGSGQTLEWIAAHADGWLTYPRSPEQQARIIQEWRNATQSGPPARFKPFAQSLYIDLAARPDAPPQPIHLGYRLGRRSLLELLYTLRDIGVNHVIFNLKYGQRPAAEVLEELGREVLPLFPAPAAR